LPIVGKSLLSRSTKAVMSIDYIGIIGNTQTMRISQKGLYALQAMMMLARHYNQGAIRIRDIAYEEELPEKFLELILLELKNARMVESVRGAKGGYQLRRAPSEIRLSEIIRLIDGPLAPFGDAEQLRSLIDRDAEHRALYQVFLDVRDAAAKILDSTSLAEIMNPGSGRKSKGRVSKKKGEASILPMVVHGNAPRGEK
jgi:Rrf2 family protein